MRKPLLKVAFLTLSIMFLVIISLFSVYAVGAESSVTIPNGSFDEWRSSNNSDKISSWKCTSSYLYFDKSTNSISGYSVTVLAGGNDITLSLKDKVSVTGGENYTFGYKCKSENSSGSTAKIKIDTYDAEEICQEEIESDYISVFNDGWSDVSITFDVDKTIASVKIAIIVDTSLSACYIDDAYAKINEKAAVSTLSGASLRLVKDSPGIRFAGMVDKDVYDNYVKNYSNVSAGILITTEDNLSGASDFTIDGLGGKQYATITAEKWNNEDTAATDGFYGFFCALTNIREQNIKKRFCVRAYVKYDLDGATKFVYGNYSFSENARSIQEVAIMAGENADEYTQEQLEIITYYANFNNE